LSTIILNLIKGERMSLIFEERASDSHYVEAITQGQAVSAGSAIRPAELNWHMVLVREPHKVQVLVVGPWTMAGVVSWPAGAEVLWIKFKLGTFMPHFPTRDFLNAETILPQAAHRSFWLNSSTWQLPDYENADTFVDWLVRHNVLMNDPIVNAALQNQLPDMSARTVRYRFLRATGLTQRHIHHVERAKQAAALLSQGVSILDTVYEVGYFDQAHLTRSLKQSMGYTPAQLLRLSQFE
jgi:AraC-like DNA-binding protein